MERIDGNTSREEVPLQDKIVYYSSLTGLPSWVVSHFLKLGDVGKGQFQWLDYNNGIVQMHPDTAKMLIGVVQSGTTDFDSHVKSVIHDLNRDAKVNKGRRRR